LLGGLIRQKNKKRFEEDAQLALDDDIRDDSSDEQRNKDK